MSADLPVAPGPARTWPQAVVLTGCVAALLVTSPLLPAARAVPDVIQRLLMDDFGFARGDLAAIDRGAAVARSLEMRDDREVSAVGAVRIAVPPAFYVEQMLDIVRFKQHEAVLQIGVFGASPVASDMARLTLEREDLNRLRDCSASHCDFNLSLDALARVKAGVTWGTDAGHARATQQFRQVLADLVRDYRVRGDRALMTYAHGSRQLSTAAEFKALVESPPSLLGRFPSLYEHVVQYPAAASPSARDVVYWSKEKVGPRTVTSVTHIALVRLPVGAAPAVYAGASRQLYGTQLYEASLGVTLVLQNPADTNGMYLVYANRSRVDAIGGIFGVIKRGVVRSRARAAVPATLERAKLNAERQWQARDTSAQSARRP